METNDILIQKSLGSWKPNQYLTNVANMYFEEPTLAHRRIFPICPVDLPSGHYYEFSKADLARDNVQLKPPYGAVSPAVMGIRENNYSCKVHQVLLGIDEIMNLPYARTNAAVDARRVKVRTITEQINLHLEVEFAQKFFNSSAWSNTWTGAANANNAQKKFKKFSDASVDPAKFIDERATEIRRNGRRKPNKLALGMDVFAALKNNPAILDRVKYTGSTANPAYINENILAQIFGIESVVVLDATYNSAQIGAAENMQFACDAKSALLLYAPQNPTIEDASAGYLFTWNISGRDLIAISEYDGQAATHTRFIEGLTAYDFRKTSDDLAIFLKDCVD